MQLYMHRTLFFTIAAIAFPVTCLFILLPTRGAFSAKKTAPTSIWNTPIIHHNTDLPPPDECIYLKSQNLRGCFRKHYVQIQSETDQVRLRLVAWGRGHNVSAVTLIRAHSRFGYFVYHSDNRGITEWWRITPVGFEQGFNVDKLPESAGALILVFSASQRPLQQGNTLKWQQLRYGKLSATDATGKPVSARLRVSGHKIYLALDVRHAQLPIRIDPLVWSVQETSASDAATGGGFGTSVAISGDGSTAIIGAPGQTINGIKSGAVYAFTKSNDGTWTQTAEFAASDSARDDNFGTAVAISSDGKTALIGAPVHSVSGHTVEGAAYIFSKAINGSWTQTAELTAADGTTSDEFGWSASLSANGAVALIGSPYHGVNGNSYQGAAYIFMQGQPGVWNEASELLAGDGVASDYFGFAVSFSSNGVSAAVGAPNHTVNNVTREGAVYTFANSTGTWAQTGELNDSSGSASESFGYAVSLSGDGTVLAVGVPYYTANNMTTGSVQIFTQNSGVWGTGMALISSDPQNGGDFGYSVALSNDGTAIVVGARGQTFGSNAAQGAAYVFNFANGTWQPGQEFTTADGDASDGLGYAVATTGDANIVAAGAFNHVVNGYTDAGATYFFSDPLPLSLSLSVPRIVSVTGQFTSTITLANAGGNASLPLTLEFPIPVGTQFETATAGQGACALNGDTLDCMLGQIAAASTVNITVQLTPTVSPAAVITENTDLVSVIPALTQTATTTAVVLPSISGLQNIIYTLGDEIFPETMVINGTGALIVTAHSSNQALLADANIGGCVGKTAATTCTLTFSPSAGRAGSTTVTVIVTDSYGDNAQDSFTLTINPAPPSPPPPPSGGASAGGGNTGTISLLFIVVLIALRLRYKTHRYLD